MQRKIKEYLLSSTSKGTAVLGLGNIISAVLAIIFTILIARSLGPENWGSVAVAFGLAAITQAIFDLGLTSALFRFKADKDPKELQKLFSLRLYSTFAAAVLTLLFVRLISGALFPKLDPALALLGALSGLIYLIFDFFITWQQVKRNYILASVYIILNNLLRLTLTLIIILIKSPTSVDFLLIYLVSPLVLSLLICAKTKAFHNLQSVSFKYFKRIFAFSGFLGANRIISVLTGKLDTLLIFTLLSSYETGIYSAAKQLVFGVPLLVGSLATVIASRFSHYQGEVLKKYYLKTLLLAAFLALGLILTSTVAPLIIKLFGQEYNQSGWILSYLLLATVPFVLATPAVNLLIYSFGKTKIIAANSAFVLLITYFGNLYLIPVWGIHGVIATQLISYLFLLAVSFAYATKYLYKT